MHPPAFLQNVENVYLFSLSNLLQMTFSINGTKMTPQAHLLKFEIFLFSDNTNQDKIFHNFFDSRKYVIE